MPTWESPLVLRSKQVGRRERKARMILIIMGVSGVGKTTIGKALAEKLSYEFHDADDFHPIENKQKMIAGMQLNDEDRSPWLTILKEEIKRWNENNINSVLACSALKKSYRLQLISGIVENRNSCHKGTSVNRSDMDEDMALCNKSVLCIYLYGSIEVISDRMSKRVDHFMPAMLLQSQFEDLEEPHQSENFISIDVSRSVNDIVHEIIQKIFTTDQYQK